jgi:hypothetical protein
MTADFHGTAEDGRHVVVEMQRQLQDYFHREALFYAGSHLAGAGFRCADDGAQPRAQTKVSAIQFVNYDACNLPPEEANERRFRVSSRLSVDRVDGVDVFQVGLPWIAATFPVAAEVAKGWTGLDWWCYLLKFSGDITDDEIERCQGLSPHAGILSNLKLLKLASWSEEARVEYASEINGPVLSFETLRAVRADGAVVGRLRGQLRGLLRIFLKVKSLDSCYFTGVAAKIAESLVQEIWDLSSNPRKGEASCQAFLAALRENGITILAAK